MMLRSIRSRLALSFAAIALVAAVALGAVLLATLRGFYSSMELDYLRGNAESISSVLVGMMSAHATAGEIQSQIENLAFLSQTRIQVFDQQRHLLHDSGSPQNIDVFLGVMKVTFSNGVDAPPEKLLRIISVGPKDEISVPAPPGEPPTPMPFNKVFVYRSVPAGESPFGFDLSAETTPAIARSRLSVKAPIVDVKNGTMLGTIELSEGPAYGSAILASVARGWVLSSAIAVLLAAAIGWYISRRISAPVLALTNVTARMAQGELSGRAEVNSRDEFGQLARSFNEMAGRVEDTVSALRAFVADAAHELHTPLTALHTNLELAADEENASARTLYLSRAQEQGQRLEALVSGLLDLSRVEAAPQEKPKELIDLTSLLQHLTEAFASRAEQSERIFNVSLPGNPLVVEGNAGQIQRAVENLLENALKFTEQGGTIQLSLEAENQQALIRVTDTGIGIPPADLPRLFGRFHRGQNSSMLPGSGLGLAIVRAIVESHQGRAEAKSNGVGQGSSFLIRLPLIQ